MSDPLIRRRDAAQKMVDAWRERPLRLGCSDCARMASAHLRLLGYKVKLPASGSYASVRSALKAIRAMGFDSVAAVLDALGLERIAPAAALVGDLLMLESADELGSLCIALGNGRVLGYHEDVAGGAAVLQPLAFVAAWRVEPR